MKFRAFFGPSQDAHLDGALLSAYLDGQVKPDERRRVETHLGTCPACQSELASLRRTVTMLHALPRVPVPRAFTLSEAQVGLRKPAGEPTWFGGLARGLAAISAVALVAVMAAVLLRQPTWQPAQNLAQLAAPAPAAEAPSASAPGGPAATAETIVARAEPQDAADATKGAPAGVSKAPVITQAAQARAATKAPAPAAAPLAAGTQIAKLPATPAGQPATAIVETQPLAAKAPADPPTAPSAAAAAPVTSPPTDRPAAALAAAAAPPVAPPTATLTVARAASEPNLAAAAGKSGGTPAAPSPALAELPGEASVVYADTRGLWAVDRATGARPLVQAAGVSAPAISGDRAWVAYRLTKGNSSEVWTVPANGGVARQLLTERDLSDGLPQGYRERRIADARWLPGKQVLLLTTRLTPVAQDAASQLEMWTVDAASGARKLLASGDAGQRPTIAPNGAQIAFFRLALDKAGEGSLWLIGADGEGARAVLRFPTRPDAVSFSGQIAWLPDSSGLWAAIPDAQQPNALILYRVPLNGEAQQAGRVEGQEAYWSPNGARLAYTRWTGETTGPKELILAAADGAKPQLYATLPSGHFSGWSPDSARFLYEENGQLSVGAPDAKPQRLATEASEPRWLGPSQIVYQAGQGDTRQLILQTVEGKAVPLQTLPAGAMVDSIRP